MNRWLDAAWLGSDPNWHQRWRGSICAAIEDPRGAAREIEHWAGNPYMAQVLILAEPRPSWGDPKYDPVWEAATRHDITVSCHLVWSSEAGVNLGARLDQRSDGCRDVRVVAGPVGGHVQQRS